MENLRLSSSVKEDVRRQFESDWLGNRARPLREYLPDKSEASYLPTLVELVCIEIEFRWRLSLSSRQGSGPTAFPLVEDYLPEFHVLASVPVLLRLVREEWIVRAACGERPTIEEIRARFPQFAELADAELRPDDDEIAARSHALSTSHLPAAELSTLEYFPLARDALDPTLTFCVRREDGTVESLSERHEQATSLPGFSKGLVVAGRYQLERELGRGGMGRVFLANDKRLERRVAIKVMLLPPQSRNSAERLDREQNFAAEAKLGAGLLHPAIATVFDYGLHRGLPYTVFEYIRGISLRELISKRASVDR